MSPSSTSPSPTSSTRVLLVRHGQSEWNAIGRWQGQADPSLSDLGRLQAREAAQAVGTVDAVWASDLRRAAETAAIIAEHIGVGPVILDPDLRERDAGEYSGLTRPEIEERFPGYLAAERRPPGWEPDEHLLARALRALGTMATEVPGGEVLAVTHGGLVYRIETHLGADRSRLANAEGRWIDVEAAGDGSPGALRLGDRVHPRTPPCPGRSDRAPGGRAVSGLGVALVVHAEPGGRQGGEALVRDGLAAGVAPAVGAAVEPGQRPVDVAELGLDLLEDGELLLPLERVAGGVGGVLRDVRQLGRAVLLGLVVEVVVAERGAQVLEPLLLLRQLGPRLVVVHDPVA
jgi:broad specificity phosphatase PhoE